MSNQPDGVMTNSLQQFAAFDRLPPEIRRVIALAPYEYVVTGFLKQFKTHRSLGGDVATYRGILIQFFCDELQQEARKTYGPDHPDAVRHRLEKARRHA